MLLLFLPNSFFEYLFKAAVLFADNQYLHIFQEAYKAVMKYIYVAPWYIQVDMEKGQMISAYFDSLQVSMEMAVL